MTIVSFMAKCKTIVNIRRHQQLKTFTMTYRIESGTVCEDELNVAHKLLNTLVMVEVRFAQLTSYGSQVHWRHNNLVVVRNLVHIISNNENLDKL